MCDVGKKSERDTLVKHIQDKYGRLDVLVPNVAASTHMGPQFEITEKRYDAMWNINVKSTFFLIKECLPLLRKGSASNICMISSVTGRNPNYMIGIYGSTKAAMDNMVRWMADELMADGIRVTAIAPGLIETEFSGPLWKGNKELHPMSKGQASDIGAVAATICSVDGKFMNGEVY